MKLRFSYNQLALALAIVLALIGINAQWDAQSLEQFEKSIFDAGGLHYRGMLSIWGPYALAWLMGLGIWLLIERRQWLNVRRFWPWFIAALVFMALPLSWHQLIDGTRLYYPAEWASLIHSDFYWPAPVSSLIVALPLLSFAVAALEERACAMPFERWQIVRLAAALTCLILVVMPFTRPEYLFALPLIIALAAPNLRKVALLSFGTLAGLFVALLFFAAPYRFHRFMESTFPTSWNDPFGMGYQVTHALMLFSDTNWIGGAPRLMHLPAAMSQYLPISIAAHWGLLAFAGVFVLMAAWLALTWPRVLQTVSPKLQGEEVFRLTAARMVWFVLLFATLDALAVNTVLVQPHGAGMPLLTGNWGWIVLASVLMGLNTSASHPADVS